MRLKNFVFLFCIFLCISCAAESKDYSKTKTVSFCEVQYSTYNATVDSFSPTVGYESDFFTISFSDVATINLDKNGSFSTIEYRFYSPVEVKNIFLETSENIGVYFQVSIFGGSDGYAVIQENADTNIKETFSVGNCSNLKIYFKNNTSKKQTVKLKSVKLRINTPH